MICTFEDHSPQLPEEYYVSKSAMVIGNVVLRNQASIWFGSVLRGDIEPIVVGERSNIQDNSVVHTSHGLPVIVGNDVTVGHNVTLHACTIGDNCLIGMGAILLDGCTVGNNCIVGAGALVKQGQQIPDGSLAVGSPARVIRKLDDKAIRDITGYADRYVDLLRRYRCGGMEKI